MSDWVRELFSDACLLSVGPLLHYGWMGDDVVRAASSSGFPRFRSPAEDDRPTGDDRDRSANSRDLTAEERDSASALGDEHADVRDLYAEARDLFDGRLNAGAASDRMGARRDRQGSATDRGHAADDRHASSMDRIASADDRAASSIDQLTGAYRRDTGMVELERETARANRTGQPFVLAFVDVDGLKATNDTLGHAAGDQLLVQIVGTMRKHLRSYDLIVRFGGDEFVCALLAIDIDKATERFILINAALAAQAHASISVGLAEYQLHDTLDGLLARADHALLTQRQQWLGRS
jgi:diguanylate cyclase (GGDEF)-like protein